MPMDDGDTIRAMAYVEHNPLRANMVRVAEEFVWPSASVHVRGHDDNARGRTSPQPFGPRGQVEYFSSLLLVFHQVNYVKHRVCGLGDDKGPAVHHDASVASRECWEALFEPRRKA